MIGKTILLYKILEKRGQGGMGVVYKAEDTKLERSVAIKFLPRHIAANAEERGRFKIEAKAAAALNHPNIATIHSIEEVDDEMFIVMEYIAGRELKEIVQSEIPNLQSAIDYASQIAEGLKAAHTKGITHRDIKSSNIMVTESGQVKIMDFGLAKMGSDVHLTKAGTTLGTVTYMSPEQARGEPVDHRSDIWSFGVVLYEMLSGKLPFGGDYEQAVTYAIWNEEPEPVTGIRDDVSEALHKILKKSLQKDAGDRYQNTGNLLVELNKVVTQLTAESAEEEEEIPSIAVLPFANMSADSEQEYFCEGMAEEIINALTRVKNLHVVARTSAFSFKGQNVNINKIGQELRVNHVLEGSVRKAGKRLRITAQLIKVDDGYHLWSDRYDRVLEDVLAIQEEISLAIVENLKVKLFGEQRKEDLVQPTTQNLEAYQLYLRGRFYRNKWDPVALQQAVSCYKQAIDLDPEFARAYFGLADVYVGMTPVGGMDALPPGEAYPRPRSTSTGTGAGQRACRGAYPAGFYPWRVRVRLDSCGKGLGVAFCEDPKHRGLHLLV